MTRAAAATLLRELADGDASPFGEALQVAIRALEPAKRKGPAMSPQLAAFLKFKPANTAPERPYGLLPDGWYERQQAVPEAVRVQFAYKSRDRKFDDKAVLAGAMYAARESVAV